MKPRANIKTRIKFGRRVSDGIVFDGFGKWFELYRKTADMFLCRCRLKGFGRHRIEKEKPRFLPFVFEAEYLTARNRPRGCFRLPRLIAGILMTDWFMIGGPHI